MIWEKIAYQLTEMYSIK